jgi:hypothetical protein
MKRAHYLRGGWRLSRSEATDPTDAVGTPRVTWVRVRFRVSFSSRPQVLDMRVILEAYSKLPVKMMKQVCDLRQRAEGSTATEGI